MAKNKGIKRGSAQHTARKIDLAAKQEFNNQFERRVGMAIVDTEFCLALGRMGFRSRDFFLLQETLTAVRKELACEFLEDAQADKELVYAKACLDRELWQYLPECMHRTWEERLNILDRSTPGLRTGPAENIPEEIERYASGFASWKADQEVRKDKARRTREKKRGVVNEP